MLVKEDAPLERCMYMNQNMWRAGGHFFFVSKHQGWLAWVGDENEKILPIRETPGDADDEEVRNQS